MTVTFTGADSQQHQAEIGSGTVTAATSTFSSEATGTIDVTGASNAFLSLTLTPEGASSPALTAGGYLAGALAGDILDGIDVDAEFEQIVANYESGATTDPCDPLLFLPGTDVNGSSLTDEDVSCEAATGGGAMTLDALMGLAKKYGPWIILALAGTLPAHYAPPTTPDPSQVSITPDSQTVANISQVILAQSQGKIATEQAAETAADECLRDIGRVGGSITDPNISCDATPIFFPASDNHETTANDYDGIFVGDNTIDGKRHLDHLLLHYQIANARASGKWKDAEPQCQGSTTAEPCDEYPFLSTQEAATSASALALVPQRQNSSEGGLLSGFYTRCGIRLKGAGTPFLVVPLTTAPTTMSTCGAPTS